MKNIFTLITILLAFQMTVNAAPAPIKNDNPIVKVPPAKLAPAKLVPLKLGNYEFSQGNKAFADFVISYKAGLPESQQKYQDPKKSLSLPYYKKVGNDSFVSLGCEGSIVMDWLMKA
jgi:hypothetical protein